MSGGLTCYLLDTSVFIQAARSYYGFTIAPSFWDTLVWHAQNGTIVSIDRVKDEIDRGKDELSDWANSHFHNAFRAANDEDILTAYGEVIRWAANQSQYTWAAKWTFAQADNADAWNVAYALARGCTVVTQEVSAPQAKHAIKIPDVCKAFGIECIDTFEMMRRLGVKL